MHWANTAKSILVSLKILLFILSFANPERLMQIRLTNIYIIYNYTNIYIHGCGSLLLDTLD